jgi:hypothetical protein
MLKRFRSSRQGRRGSVATGDWVFVTTILVLGAVTGLVTMRQTRLMDLSNAVKPLAVKTTSNMVNGQ